MPRLGGPLASSAFTCLQRREPLPFTIVAPEVVKGRRTAQSRPCLQTVTAEGSLEVPGAVWGTWCTRDFHHRHLKTPSVSVGGLSIRHVPTCLENDPFLFFVF